MGLICVACSAYVLQIRVCYIWTKYSYSHSHLHKQHIHTQIMVHCFCSCPSMIMSLPLRLSGHDFVNGTDRPLAISQASWGIKGLRERALNKSQGFGKNGLRVCIPLYADTIDLPFCSSCLFNVPQWIARLSINQDLCKYIDVCLETLTQIRSYCTKNEL